MRGGRVGSRNLNSHLERATPQNYTLSLHDALPISEQRDTCHTSMSINASDAMDLDTEQPRASRSEEHTSELQSLRHLVCRLLLEKKKKKMRKLSRKHNYNFIP